MKNVSVQVFKTIKDEFLKSAVSEMTTKIPYGTLVAFDEENLVLHYSDDVLVFSTDEFIKLALIVDIEEMSYEKYRKIYKENLLKNHNSAPIMKIENSNSEYSPQNPFQRLIDAGVSFKIF